jgi:very-short-patch-repair endonuclease
MKKQTQNIPTRRTNRRQLRQTSTEPEQLIWAVVRNRRLEGLKFRRQESIGPFIVDFVCQERHLVIELDGGYHDDVFERDRSREQFLESEGYRMVRFSNEDVFIGCRSGGDCDQAGFAGNGKE